MTNKNKPHKTSAGRLIFSLTSATTPGIVVFLWFYLLQIIIVLLDYFLPLFYFKIYFYNPCDSLKSQGDLICTFSILSVKTTAYYHN